MQAVGIQLSSALSNLGRFDHRSGQNIAEILSDHQHYFTLRDDLLIAENGTKQSAWVGAYPFPIEYSFDENDKSLNALKSRNLAFAIDAVNLFKDDLNQLTAGIAPHRLAIVLGTSTSGIADNQHALAAQLQQGVDMTAVQLDYAKQAMSALAQGLQLYLGWTGIAYTISTACSSSAKAFATGQRLLNADLADVVLVGGVDTLCPLTLNGFHCLDSLSKTQCQPCGANRDGINIGEAAALFVLTRDKSKVTLKSHGESMDAWHISAPHPEGLGAFQAMSQALQSANLQPSDIDYINMHGTATPQNDAMEIKAIKQLFSATHADILLSSTKHKTGHCLGAAAAIEAFICQQILSAPQQQPWLPLHYAGQIDADLAEMNYVKTSHQQQKIRHVLSNSFAFGGSNMSLLFEGHGD